jgi:subtilisin
MITNLNLKAIVKQKFTGKQLILINTNATSKSITTHSKNASLKFASFSDYKNKPKDYHKAFAEADGILFEEFGIAVVNKDRDRQVNMLTTSSKSKSTFLHSEPERYVYAYTGHTQEQESNQEGSKKTSAKRKLTALNTSAFSDSATATWGLQAINAIHSKYTGKGVNLAVLDTGFYLAHPDFDGRKIISKSFIDNQSENDLNGHGTHCAGIAAGNLQLKTKKRYGVAPDAHLFIGKVLSNTGVGSDSSILAGMEWAILNNCKVISMSLGSLVSAGETYSTIYNNLAQKALKRGSLIIAAAGNESNREAGSIIPVGHPANCPSIMAVGALDTELKVANFSCGGFEDDGGQVDIAAPGFDIFSTWKHPKNHKFLNGTSMATPFVAGIAALLWEANPQASAAEIWMQLIQTAKRLNLNASDIGAGLVQAP